MTNETKKGSTKRSNFILIVLMILEIFIIVNSYKSSLVGTANTWVRFLSFFLFSYALLTFLFRYKHKKAVSFFIPLYTTVMLWFVVELIFFVKLTYFSNPNNNIPVFQSKYTVPNSDKDIKLEQPDDILGYKLIPNQKTAVDIVYGNYKNTLHYTVDSFSRRETPTFYKSEIGKKYALFFGCSVTFGAYVNDNETSSSYFAKKDTNYAVYNYGVGGYGTQQMLAFLENKLVKKNTPQTNGIAIYNYFDLHVNRVIGDMYTYMKWGSIMPYYYLENDEVKRNGNFITGRPITRKIYSIVSKSFVATSLNINLPPKPFEKHIYLTAKIIEKSSELYKQQFGNDNFYVLILPGSVTAPSLKKYLTEMKIKFIDYSALTFNKDKGMAIPGDGHPTPLYYEKLAGYLVKSIANVAK